MLRALGLLALAAGPAPAPRLVVLGFDGADHALTARFLSEGHLPHLKALADEGTFAKLKTTNPAQSPVAWASFATGWNPGRTGVFDFLKRKDGTYLPSLALARKEMSGRGLPGPVARVALVAAAGLLGAALLRRRRLLALAAFLALGGGTWAALRLVPERVPRALPARRGETFWKRLAAHGVPTVALQAPMDFPPEGAPGLRSLAGLGVPDARGTMGSWSVFTTEPVTADNAHTETGGERVPLDPARREFETRIVGPANFLVQEELDRIEQRLPGVSGYEEHEKLAAERDALRARLDTTVPLALRWEPEARRVRIAAGGREETVAEGAWTGFLPVTFRLNPIVRLQALARFRVLEASPGLRVYQEPLSFDPSHPPAFLPLSWPEGFAVELSREIGLFDTVGWGCATNPLKDGQIGEEAFLEDVASVMQAREKMLDLELARRDARCVVAVFGEQDRVQHMMWRLTDPRSPTWDEELARRHGGAILDVYRAMDRIVGRARATGADVLVVSDHGFQPFHIGVNVNTWLVENGWLRLKGQAVLESLGKKLDDLYRPDGSDPVDWSKTRAYSMGLGKIYLNVAGREPSGIVPASERAALLRELQRQLLAWKDGEGRPVVKSALPAEEIFQGPEALTDADLFLGFHSGFRVSWVTTLLGFEKGTLAPNRQKWSGDHCSVDPDLVPGILVTNLKLDAATAALWDVAPTVLSYFGVPAPEVTDGRSLLR